MTDPRPKRRLRALLTAAGILPIPPGSETPEGRPSDHVIRKGAKVAATGTKYSAVLVAVVQLVVTPALNKFDAWREDQKKGNAALVEALAQQTEATKELTKVVKAQDARLTNWMDAAAIIRGQTRAIRDRRVAASPEPAPRSQPPEPTP